MKRILIFILALALAAMTFSCSAGAKKMKAAVDGSAGELDAYFVRARESVVALDAAVEKLLEDPSRYELSTGSMDVERGGKYKFFQNAVYTTVADDGEGVVFATGFHPVDESLKKRIKLYENALPIMKKSVSGEYADILVMDPEYSLALRYPWIDFLSTIPPKLDIRAFPWISLADRSANPSKSTVWLGEPFTALAGAGWIIVVISPIYSGAQMKAVAASNIYLDRLGTSVLGKSPAIMLFLTDKGLVIAGSVEAHRALGVKILEEYDYLTQQRENVFASDSYLLSSDANPPEIRELGMRLRRETEFQARIGGKKYFVYRKALDELPNLWVVGLQER